MGNIGPDGFPDVIGGQVTLHPGLEDGVLDDEKELTLGWKSDDWFKWIDSKAKAPIERAFSAGFLAHGAADTFAHTYVNMYSGDIFDSNDGETDVEKRHIYLEMFISDRLPPFKDINGELLGKAHELVAIEDELPIEFIKNTLLMNREVSRQYKLSSTANYLAKMYEFREKVKTLGDKYTIRLFKNEFNFTQAWLERIDNAIDEYIKMSARMSQEFMKTSEGEPYDELKGWIKCYSNAFTDSSTILSGVTEAICDSRAEVELEKEKYVFSLANFPLLNKLNSISSTLKDSVDVLKDNAGYQLIELLAVATLEVVSTKNKEATEDSLNKQFSEDESDKALLLIDDMAQRVEKEMAVDENGVMDAKKYTVLYNAIVLSKLSLLDENALNTLLKRAGASDRKEFIKGSEHFNILFNLLKTIDGNHPWLEVAPPYPRTENNSDLLWPQNREYGYKHDETHGMAFYSDEVLRFKVFNKIFKGPLSMGLEMPKEMDFSPILSSDYPYLTCKENPYPDGVDDRRCETLDGLLVDSTTTDDSSKTDWLDDIFALFNGELDIDLSLWLDTMLAQLSELGDSLVVSVKSYLLDDGSTDVEVITEVGEEGIEF